MGHAAQSRARSSADCKNSLTVGYCILKISEAVLSILSGTASLFNLKFLANEAW